MVKSVRLLVYISIFTSCVTARKDEMKGATTIDVALSSTNHALRVRCQYPTCRIFREELEISADAPLQFFQPNPQAKDLLKPLEQFSSRDIFLVNEVHGDGCPSIYRLLILDASTEKMSSIFGNCNEVLVDQNIDGVITFDFVGSKVAGRKPEKWVYRAQTQKLSRIK